MEITLGGDRLGSGNKNKLSLKNYERSTHNLSKVFKSSMATGTLVPCYTNVALNGDTFDIDIKTMVRTIPTLGPLFGSFKLQVDFFSIPMRLYIGLLHNNPLSLGMNMKNVMIPKIVVEGQSITADYSKRDPNISNSCLLKYLGISGLGNMNQITEKKRDFNGLPIFAYFDIFKNYYANTQEDNFYQITKQKDEIVTTLTPSEYIKQIQIYTLNNGDNNYTKNYKIESGNDPIQIFDNKNNQEAIEAPMMPIIISGIGGYQNYFGNVYISIYAYADGTPSLQYRNTFEQAIKDGIIFDMEQYANNEWAGVSARYYLQPTYVLENIISGNTNIDSSNLAVAIDGGMSTTQMKTTEIKLSEIDLQQIDDLRYDLLCQNTLGFTPYYGNVSQNKYKNQNVNNSFQFINYITELDGDVSRNSQVMNGLLVKTYQSDLFNNWLKTEIIDGNNGVAAITAIDTSSGKFTIDTLNLAEKVYNMLNRVAVTKGTYQDWQYAVYGQEVTRLTEIPMYEGGLSSEIVFDEVVASSSSQVSGNTQELGSLAGRGRQSDVKGGTLHIKVKEPSIIMGIASITPRIDYTQGNKWFMTELNTLDDLHKPALDGIGFQNLILEQAVASSTKINNNGTITKTSAGKVPAWINYMTDYNENYGDFANDEGYSYMVLNRNYQTDINGVIEDMTTYIDPTKFNYAFAYQELAAQNFWVQIGFDIKARRLMSAKQIPNL